MTPDDLKARTKKFAVEVIQFARSIPRDPITNQESTITNESIIKELQSKIEG